MNSQENLQKAIEATLAAGYQLNSEAFEFLSQNSDTTNPQDIMNLALEKIQDLEEKPFFIDKVFLEPLMQQLTVTQTNAPLEMQQNTVQRSIPSALKQTNEIESVFYPYARDIKTNLSILEDATGKLSSNGTLEEYLEYFQDRFKRIEHLLRQRMDVKAATSITRSTQITC